MAADASLLSVMVASEDGVFTVRRRARDVAALVGFDTQDQVRIATALGEVGREALAWWGGAVVTFGVTERPAPVLEVHIRPGPSAGDTGAGGPVAGGAGLTAAGRLMDEVRVDPHDPGVTLVKRLPAGQAVPSAQEGARLQAELAGYGPASAFDELRVQNTELLAALESLTAQKRAMADLNDELEETNRGVMAMYAQLSEELEETNRGVVALYAELDDKGQQLHEASEAKSRFLASVSHELRSPVNSVLGLARLLTEPDGDPLTDEQIRQVGLIASTARSLLGLVNGLLDLAKAESGKLDPEVAPVDLRAVFGSLRSTMAPLVAGGAVRLDIGDPAPGVTLVSDEQLLTTVLRNLLTNAVKFTEEGSVSMRAAARAGQVAITVTDTGIGIPPEHQTQVFEEFFQVPGILQSRVRGTGLGLPYVRRVTELLGGDVHLDSEPGRGTEITVRLPAEWAVPLPGDITPPAGVPVVAPVVLGTVLVADDDAAFRTVLRGLLQPRAERVIEAPDGQEALQLLRTTRCDLLVLDIQMPTVDGFRVLAELAGDDTLSRPAVLVVTSLDDAAVDQLRRVPLTVLSKSDVDAVTFDVAVARALALTAGDAT